MRGGELEDGSLVWIAAVLEEKDIDAFWSRLSQKKCTLGENINS